MLVTHFLIFLSLLLLRYFLVPFVCSIPFAMALANCSFFIPRLLPSYPSTHIFCGISCSNNVLNNISKSETVIPDARFLPNTMPADSTVTPEWLAHSLVPQQNMFIASSKVLHKVEIRSARVRIGCYFLIKTLW